MTTTMLRDIPASASKSYSRCLPCFAAVTGIALWFSLVALPAVAAPSAPPVPAASTQAAPVQPTSPSGTSPAAGLPAPEPTGSARPGTATPAASATPQATPSPPPSSFGPIELSASRVTYYSDRDMIAGEGNVDVRLANGTHITGAFFAMDLKLNRYLVAGGVRLRYHGETIEGAAFSSYLDFDRSYFVPVIQEPDRWTFIGTDYAHPLKGRQMPGDTFFLPDTSHQYVFLTAKRVTIRPKHSAFFKAVNINALGLYVPAPTYFLAFSSNPNFSQNSLAGAYFDAPLPVAGSANSLETLHERYNSPGKFYTSYEQHFVSDNAWLVASLNPATQPQKQYNVSASDKLSSAFQVQTFLQESAFQQGLGYRLSASGFANFNVTAALGGSFVVASTNLYYTSLLPMPKPGVGGALYYGDPSHPWEPDHPSNGQLSWTGFEHRINKLPLTFRLRSGLGFAHDPYVAEAYLGGVFYPSLYYNYLGGTLYTPAIQIGHSGTFFNASFDDQRQAFSLPHHIDTKSTTASLSKVFGTKFAAFVAYQVYNVGDFWGPRQTEQYPPIAADTILPYTVGPVGTLAPDYLSFRGFGTNRAVVESLVFTPNRFVQTVASMQEADDYPQPIAPEPPNEYLYGRPPLTANLDLRFKLLRTLAIDIGRSYYFNFGSLRWSPQFSIRTYQPPP
jgi:hypothetical protein